MAKKKKVERVIPKFKVPEGSHAVVPFYFELIRFDKIIAECEERKLWSLAFAIDGLIKNMREKQRYYVWTESSGD